MAFCDGMQLAQQLTDPSNKTLQTAVAAYDAESMPRSAAPLLKGRRFINLIHKQGLSRLPVLGLIWLVGSFVKLVRAMQRLIGR